MIEVKSKVKCYEVDDKEIGVSDKEVNIEVSSHWCDRDQIVIKVGKHTYTVVGSDLKVAIENAINANK